MHFHMVCHKGYYLSGLGIAIYTRFRIVQVVCYINYCRKEDLGV